MKDLADFLQENAPNEEEESKGANDQMLSSNKDSYYKALDKAKGFTTEAVKRNSASVFEDIDEENELERALEKERNQKIKKVKVEERVEDLLSKGQTLMKQPDSKENEEDIFADNHMNDEEKIQGFPLKIIQKFNS